MYYVFGLLTIIAASLLVLLVVIQNSKGGGLNSAFGGTSNLTAMIGTRRATQDIEKFTWYMALILLLFSFVANVSTGTNQAPTEPKFGNMMQAPPPQPQQQASPMPGQDGGAVQPPAEAQ